MSHEHQHHVGCCRHETVRYCPCCRVVYCEVCRKEWREAVSWTYTTYPNTTWSGTYTVPCGTGVATTIANTETQGPITGSASSVCLHGR